jgi:hypothetical protein
VLWHLKGSVSRKITGVKVANIFLTGGLFFYLQKMIQQDIIEETFGEKLEKVTATCQSKLHIFLLHLLP